MRLINYVNNLTYRFSVAAGCAGGALLCGLFVAGCTMLDLQRNLREIDHSIILAGRALAPPGTAGNIVALVYEETPQGNAIVDFQQLDSDGHYVFLVPDGRQYFLVAFQDTNNNMRYDTGEPVGYYGKPTPLSESVGDSDQGITLELSAATAMPAQFALDLHPQSFVGNNNIPLVFGDVISLDDPKLSREQARRSLWAPLDFAKENGIGVFFLEKYDPQKIPVLFVHGFGGTPLDWESFLMELDRSCFQPWLFYYPTGVRLSKSERLMSAAIEYFQREYGFADMFVVAHSMGGLIARASIVNSLSQRGASPVKLLVTLSTPWNGSVAAARGVSNSPVVMPAWIDIQPNSSFITSLFDVNIAAHLDYYLFFSFNDAKSVHTLENDGTVSLASQLDERAQREATQLFGVNASHRDILRDPSIVASFKKILATTAARLQDPNLKYHCTSGRELMPSALDH